MVNRFFAFLKKHNVHIDRNILRYGICVIIATILWFLNALNKDYTAEVTYPVKYVNFPKGKHLVSELPKTIMLEVNAKGFALLGYKVSTSFLPITFDVNSYCKHQLEKNNVLEYTINTAEIQDKISSQLSTDIKLLNIRPETINFEFSRAVMKKLPVRPVVDYTLRKQYILKNAPKATPDSLVVSGPASIIDTIRSIPTQKIKFKEVDEIVVKTTKTAKIPGLNLEEMDIKVELVPERSTEAKKTIGVRTLNLPDSLAIKLFPDQIQVTYDVGLSRYDRITEADFVFTVDYEQINGNSYLTVKAERVPAFIQNLVFSPQKVEYILEEK